MSAMSIMRSMCRCISSIATATIINVAGDSFRDFLDGKLPHFPGVRPTLHDWADHLTTIFPEVRLKNFLEMRGADAGGLARSGRCPRCGRGCFTIG